VLDLISRHWSGRIEPSWALTVKPVSEAASRRVFTFAFEYARCHGYGKVTAVHKASAMRCTDGLFLETGRRVAEQYSDIGFDDRLIDSLCASLIRDPERFGVLATLNFYGDLLSDLAAALVGGIGLVPGANYGEGVAVFEAAHGSAPRYAGQHRMNPMAMILTGALLLRHLGDDDCADRVEAAVNSVLEEGKALTYDLERTPAELAPATTDEVAEAVIRSLGMLRAHR
jgi:isocitrate dehydrogenase (NAD+)